MRFIKTNNPDLGATDLANRISGELNAGNTVLWMICGGSNIPTAVEVLKLLNASLNSPNNLKHLTVTLTDERYGPVGHKDSNWQQLVDSGFDFTGINSFPVLTGKELQQTVDEWSFKLEDALMSNQVTIAQFGIGPDAHIAGILPKSEATKAKGIAFVYIGTPFTRITITFDVFKKISAAYVFAFGENKRKALTDLHIPSAKLDEQPCQVLRKVTEVVVYTQV